MKKPMMKKKGMKKEKKMTPPADAPM